MLVITDSHFQFLENNLIEKIIYFENILYIGETNSSFESREDLEEYLKIILKEFPIVFWKLLSVSINIEFYNSAPINSFGTAQAIRYISMPQTLSFELKIVYEKKIFQ